MSMPEILPPEILTAAEAAWGRAQEGREVPASKDVGSAAIFGALDGAVREARKKGSIGLGLEGTANPEIKELFERDIEDYKAIFAGAGINMPPPVELAQGGIDFRYLAELKEERPDYDLVVAPLTLPLGIMRQFISRASESLPNIMPATPGKNSRALSIDKKVIDNWDAVMETTIAGWKFPVVGEDRWAAFLLSNDDDPNSEGLSYDQGEQDGPVVPLVSYTAYQMHRLRQGMSPVDRYGICSWTAGKFTAGDKTYAPFAGWAIMNGGLLTVGYYEASQKSGDLGVRFLQG